MTESRIPCNTTSTVKVVQDTNGDLKCTKKSNFDLPAIKTISYGLDSIIYLRSYDLEGSTGQIERNNVFRMFQKKVSRIHELTI